MERKRSPDISFMAPDWIEALIQEYEEEAKSQHSWPPLLLQSSCRKILWNLCDLLGVSTKGVPASACRLLERYLSRHIRTFLQVPRDPEEWERYKDVLSSQYYLAMGSCIQLAAKMVDLLAPLTATKMSSTFSKLGIEHTKTEIIDMEYHVFNTLDFRISLWTSLDIAEFLAVQVGITSASLLEAVEHVMNLTEYHRDQLELHMRCYDDVNNKPGPSTSRHLVSESSPLSVYEGASKATLHNLHICAGAVVAAARYMRRCQPDTSERLATMTRVTCQYVTAIADVIVMQIIPDKKHIPILKKRRLR